MKHINVVSNPSCRDANNKSPLSVEVTTYVAANKPKIDKVISIKEVLTSIKHGDKSRVWILKAREFGKKSEQYQKIKTEILPTFRFNFIFENYANNSNITEPTGFLYLDVDDVDAIPDSEYIFAKWKSLSGTGYAILVKVKNLNLLNFKETYLQVAQEIGIRVDVHAAKATQQTILSYDPDLYFNECSKEFNCLETKVSNHLKKEKECIDTCDTFSNGSDIRYNNIDSYFIDDTPYIVFKEKEFICNPYIPQKIFQGARNATLYQILSQFALLNLNKGSGFLRSLGQLINRNMYPKLSNEEINKTVDSVINGRRSNTLKMHYNEERRILFNPAMKFTRKEKMDIVNRELGQIQRSKTRQKIYKALEAWNFIIDGEITQKSITEKTGMSLSTIKRYWNEFRSYIDFLERE
ncbi:BT4734/BF3469 family protein [Flavobacterium sp. DG1-102-2]|uniref:BT4734/BF3469 family protein n=1 Tax=Flavobacterium sp. DG1-102-2 TaxID=3081663 RepID=UPI0029490AE0|nr:BT4734/BF3469 family protein [Flavobacterium sp. DG1-102-2]MDV6169498.1 BT4734/BF3469 family protein [Flavobacterium sp. DG1-102-2]